MSVLLSPLLDQFDWLEHGFGTRRAALAQDAMASLKQIHSNIPHLAGQSGCIGEGDALLTDRPGLAVSIRTADCYPILLADPEHRAVAAIHAGWRGTAAGIVGEALARMRNSYGTQTETLYAVIGPGIGACCYQVGLEVAQKFGRDQAGRLDLAAENRSQLLDAGVTEARIDSVKGCTFCEPDRYFSYRREGERAGRMISFIRVR